MPVYWTLKRWAAADRERVVDRLGALRKLLARELPQRTADHTLLLATWNLRDFDSNKFGHGPRLPEAFHYIAEVINAFDLVALQEVGEDMRPFERLMALLGPAWHYIATDLTEGVSGNGERMVFVYDRRKVQFKHIAGELVLPRAGLVGGEHQFARSPFLVRFQSGWFKFYLCTAHLYYGDESGAGYARRVAEIDALARFLKKRADEDRQNYILLGDLNVVSPGDVTMRALRRHGFVLPADLVLDNAQLQWASNLGGDKHYDQIAFLVRKNELALGPSRKHAGVFNPYQAVYTDGEAELYHGLSRGRGKWPAAPATAAARRTYYRSLWRSWQLSDHLPLYVELRIDFTEQYLARIRAGEQPLDPPRPDIDR